MENKIKIPETVKDILIKLNENSFQAFVVGGCVRDFLLGRTPKDWDICTDATPNEVKTVFEGEKIIDTGLKHGTVSLLRNNVPYEITTFRTDGNYTDGRHPDNVQYVKTLKEDLFRRDFTINAMAADRDGNIIDYNGGLKDLEHMKIRCVGNPNDRFREDSLRILRALRFAARYRFDISCSTKNAIHQNKKLLNNISQERITTEFRQIIRFADKKLLLEFADIIEIVIPEIGKCRGFKQNNPHHIYDVYEHIVTSVDTNIFSEPIRLALLFHDIGKPYTYVEDEKGIGHFPKHAIIGAEMVNKIMKRMRFDNKTIDEVILLIKNHDITITPSLPFARRILRRLGVDQTLDLLEVIWHDKTAQSNNPDRDKTLKDIITLDRYIEQVLDEQNCLTIKDLAINGNDLKEIGIPEGPQIGKLLGLLLDFVIDNPEMNKKQVLLSQLSRLNQRL